MPDGYSSRVSSAVRLAGNVVKLIVPLALGPWRYSFLGFMFFSCGSTLAFRDGPQGWDASHVSAAIPSEVGFLGDGVIFKEPLQEGSGGQPIVHGLTTARFDLDERSSGDCLWWRIVSCGVIYSGYFVGAVAFRSSCDDS